MGIGRLSGASISGADIAQFRAKFRDQSRTHRRDSGPREAVENKVENKKDSSVARARTEPATTARATTKIIRDSSSIRLSLQTAEGDTVEISIDAERLRQSERGFAQGPEGRIRQRSDAESSSLKASVNVTGDLNEEELGDIQKLLQSLSSGGTPKAGEGEFDTVSSYNYSHQKTREVSRSTVQLYA